jgi:hypothetical protein
MCTSDRRCPSLLKRESLLTVDFPARSVMDGEKTPGQKGTPQTMSVLASPICRKKRSS